MVGLFDGIQRLLRPAAREPGHAEGDLVARARRGDRTAFGELYALHAPQLYRRILLPRLGDPAAAEEALAETFCAALVALPGYEPRQESLGPWLTRIAINKATDLHRRRASAGRALQGYERLLEPLRPPTPSAEEQLTRHDEGLLLRGRIDRTLAAIHPRYRQALELRLLQERSRPECASSLGVKVETFDVLLLRAVRAFREAWERGSAARSEEGA